MEERRGCREGRTDLRLKGLVAGDADVVLLRHEVELELAAIAAQVGDDDDGAALGDGVELQQEGVLVIEDRVLDDSPQGVLGLLCVRLQAVPVEVPRHHRDQDLRQTLSLGFGV